MVQKYSKSSFIHISFIFRYDKELNGLGEIYTDLLLCLNIEKTQYKYICLCVNTVGCTTERNRYIIEFCLREVKEIFHRTVELKITAFLSQAH